MRTLKILSLHSEPEAVAAIRRREQDVVVRDHDTTRFVYCTSRVSKQVKRVLGKKPSNVGFGPNVRFCCTPRPADEVLQALSNL